MIQELQRIVERGTPWKHYARAVEIREMAEMFNAEESEKQRKQITKYRRTEDAELEDQRIRVSNPVTGAALAPAYAVYRSLSRVAPMALIEFKDKTKGERIRADMSVFYARKPVLEYTFNQCLNASIFDPNSWIIIESDPVFGQGGTVAARYVYPEVFPCNEVWDVQINKSGIPVAVTIKQVKEAKAGETYNEWRYYTGGMTTHAVEAHKDAEWPKGYTPVEWMVDKKPVIHYVLEYPNTTKTLPGACLGAYMADTMDYYVTLYNEANPQLKELIKTGNLADVHEIEHAFAERFEFSKRCEHVNQQSMEHCQGGYYNGIRTDDHRCHQCGGHGYIVANSEQVTKRLPMPETADAMLDLSKFVYYVDRPLDLLERFDSREQLISFAIYLTIFNQDTTPRKVATPGTATEFVLNFEAQYNKVVTFVRRVEDVVEMIWTAAAGHWDVEIDVEYKYPADLKFQSFAELVANYKATADAGLDASIRDHVRDQILRRMYENNPALYDEAKALEAWKPFAGKSPEDTAFILSGRDVTDPERVLWEGFDLFQRETMVSDGGMFHKKDYAAQEAIVTAWISKQQARAKYLDAGGGAGADLPVG
jgi:hypothetical protein